MVSKIEVKVANMMGREHLLPEPGLAMQLHAIWDNLAGVFVISET